MAAVGALGALAVLQSSSLDTYLKATPARLGGGACYIGSFAGETDQPLTVCYNVETEQDCKDAKGGKPSMFVRDGLCPHQYSVDANMCEQAGEELVRTLVSSLATEELAKEACRQNLISTSTLACPTECGKRYVKYVATECEDRGQAGFSCSCDGIVACTGSDPTPTPTNVPYQGGLRL